MTPGVVVMRGGHVESEHRVHVAVSDSGGRLVALHGDPHRLAFYRSAAKPMQALPLVEDGVLDRFGLDDRELALCCASHSAEPEHLDVARGILEKIGLDEDDLECGPHPPLDEAAARAVIASGQVFRRIHNNCSGKHAGMLALALHHGWPREGYRRAGHPVQLRMRTEVGRWSCVPEGEIATGVDGCGVVSFALPVSAMARSFARFAASARAGGAAARVVGAMTAHPFLVAGTGRVGTAVMERAGDRVFVKTGAEGVYAGALLDEDLGFALKVEDGARRANGVALLRVLTELGALTPEDVGALATHVSPPVMNTVDQEVGRLDARFRLERRG